MSVNFIKYQLSTLILVLLCHISVAQKFKDVVANGDLTFADNNFFAASQYYQQAILLDSFDVDVQYKYAEASRLNYDYEVANYWYQKVYKNQSNENKYPECVFWLASTYKSIGRYKEAKQLFAKYIQLSKKESFYLLKAKQELLACEEAKWLIDNPNTNREIIQLDSSVNSVVSEYSPFKVDSVLYFSSIRKVLDTLVLDSTDNSNIYEALKRGDSWLDAIVMDSTINDSIHNANFVINQDKSRAYISRCKQVNASEYSCAIYSSSNMDGVWTPFVKLPEQVNAIGYTTTQPAVAMIDGQQYLYFSSNREGGYGKMDIWYSSINEDGTFGAAINAGEKVNSIGNEITPFYCGHCQKLFFSSTWHAGLGGFDVFESQLDSAGYTDPINLGVPINSAYNDIYFNISNDNNEAFFSSNRTGSFFENSERCCNDIYMFTLPKPPPPPIDSTIIWMATLKQLPPIELYFHNDEPDKKTMATLTNINYEQSYIDYAALKGKYKQEFGKGKDEDTLLRMNSIDTLFNQYVDLGMKQLEEFTKLLVLLVKENKQIEVTIKGYCSPLASTRYNQNLAQRRVESLRNYLNQYNNGVLQPFINGNDSIGCINIIEEGIGELEVAQGVSDDYYDVKNSIYNPRAALERKIRILAVDVIEEKK